MTVHAADRGKTWDLVDGRVVMLAGQKPRRKRSAPKSPPASQRSITVESVRDGVHVLIEGLRLGTRANTHGVWKDRYSRDSRERRIVGAALARVTPPAAPVLVRIDVYRPHEMDTDNLATACKCIRDEVSAWLGVDDRSPLIEWRIEHVRASKRHAVGICATSQPVARDRPMLTVVGARRTA